MKEKELKEIGFTKRSFDGEYYFVKRISRNIKLITNDTWFNRGKDEWKVGIQENNDDILFFPRVMNTKEKISGLISLLNK